MRIAGFPFTPRLAGLWLWPVAAAVQFGLGTCAFGSDAAPSKALRPDTRVAAAPAGGAAVKVNPPALLWPSQGEGAVLYAVRLSQDASFPPSQETLSAEGFRWAFFNPHRRLKEGTWLWQYAVLDKDKKPRWSPTQEFRVDASARVFETPPAETMLARAAKERPRLLVAAGDLAALRERMKGTPALQGLIAESNKLIGKNLPEESGGKSDKKGATERQNRDFAKWASKGFASQMTQAVSALVPAYLMSGDERFGREAVRRAVHVAGWDPKGVTAPNVSDFSDGSCMRLMATTYDSCYALMNDEERRAVREAMAFRARRFYEHNAGRLECRAWNAHIWQHIFLDFTDVALATLDEIPEAREWASYFYEAWIARFPLMGGDDGGWAEGANYFKVSYDTLLSAPSLLGRLTGADFFDQPWYRNNVLFHLYTCPPQSASDGFGDGGENEEHPESSRSGAFVDFLARRFGDPYGLWYSRQLRGDKGDLEGVSNTWLLRAGLWRQEAPSLAPKPPTDLPQAHVFPDVGIVSMHTDLGDAGRDLMVGFRSSPFGGGGHMHASQNTFNVLIGGERLFANSGYYVSAGDEHCNEWYRATKGHNCVLIDGKGQVNGREGYGTVTQFLHGAQISYCQGDASHAYGDAGLTKFRRTLALLRPSTIVVYDELEADHPAQWSWRLHSKAAIKAESAGGAQRFTASVSKGRGQADVWGWGSPHATVDDKFDPPAVNWRGRKIVETGEQYPDQWHATVEPEERAPATRFLAVIQARLAADNAPLEAPLTEAGGAVRVGAWRIRAELDPSRPPTLSIASDDGDASLTANGGSATVRGVRTDASSPDSTLLVEWIGGERIVRETRDAAPEPPQ